MRSLKLLGQWVASQKPHDERTWLASRRRSPAGSLSPGLAMVISYQPREL